MNRAVGAETLTDVERQRFVETIDKARALLGSQFIFSAPIRDATDRLCEVRFYKDSGGQQPLAVVRIAEDGSLLPVERL